MGWIDGNPGQVLNRLAASAASRGLTIVGTWIILRICGAELGVRVKEQDEIAG